MVERRNHRGDECSRSCSNQHTGCLRLRWGHCSYTGCPCGALYATDSISGGAACRGHTESKLASRSERCSGHRERCAPVDNPGDLELPGRLDLRRHELQRHGGGLMSGGGHYGRT
jgi:hypothetical protein